MMNSKIHMSSTNSNYQSVHRRTESISDKSKSETIKTYVDRLQRRPMFEEHRWDEYKVIDTAEFLDSYKCNRKSNPVRVSAIRHIAITMRTGFLLTAREELLLDGIRLIVGRGDTVTIRKGIKHTSGLSLA